MRGDELTAFKKALDILSNKVEGRANAVNKRAFIQDAPKKAVSPPAEPTTKKADSPAAKANTEAGKSTLKSISFLQKVSSSLSEEARTQSAIAVIRKEGQRLHSLTLTSFAERISAPRFSSDAAPDPFKKVKGLIQKLIERLLAESKAEASKKGFCDTELGKARKDRDFRWQEANDLSADLAGLEAKEDALTEEIKTLKKEIKDETEALKETTEDRDDEKEANMKTIKTAKEGFEAVNEALLVLKSFYKQAAKAAFVQASPVDEDTAGAGFSGNYKGNQSGAQAIFALLETISSDFDRTIRTTEEEEHNAHRAYVEYSQAAKASIGSKTTKQELDEQDLKTTKTSLKTKSQDLRTAMDLLDKALQELEELKPTCIDTGMSYSERVAKRKEEIKALQNAHCLLLPDNNAGDC
jgi:chromosome segregation ATPase